MFQILCIFLNCLFVLGEKMACDAGILNELTDLVNQIGKCPQKACCKAPCDPPPCYTTCGFPFAQVMMSCPPPIIPPTAPEPVKPLQLPCPFPPCNRVQITDEQRDRWSIDNFYNWYNVDYKDASLNKCPPPPKVQKCCEDYTRSPKEECPDPGCPTGFKPCSMKLTPPPNCDPLLPWCAQVQPCPPKRKPGKAKANVYCPGPCTRPCCKHWEPKEGPCLYDDPCKAHCFNHPPGIKPSGRWP